VDRRAVGYAQLERAGLQVIRRAKKISGCLVWPVGEAAERVAAAVTLVSRGEIEVGAWNSPVEGRRVLVVVVAGVSALSLDGAAAQLRRRGALEVHGCGVAVNGADELDSLDTYTRLEIGARTPSALALVDDAA
jgi:hypothetical protein